MTAINLRGIFCHLVGNENFLSKIVENDNKQLNKKKEKKRGCNLMTNMVSEYHTLAPYDKQNYDFLPSIVKYFITPDYFRLGIKNVMEKNLMPVNISFINSLNILIRPDIYNNNINDHLKNLALLETFVTNSIRRNFQIDKTKNTSKIKENNKLLVKDFITGKISPLIIQCLVNIFEINLLIFDLTKMETYFYWAYGYKYPYINPFNNIHCMTYVQGNYEPLMLVNSTVSEKQRRKIYMQFFSKMDEIKFHVQPAFTLHTLIYLDTWNINPAIFIKIIKHCIVNKPNIMAEFNKLMELEKHNEDNGEEEIVNNK